MSLSKNQNFQFWKEVEARLRSTVFTCCGDRVIDLDRSTVSQVLTLWCLLIQDLCGASRLRSNQKLRAWIFQVGSYPLDEVVDTLKSLSGFMRDYNRDMGRMIDYETFKQSQLGKGSLSRILLQPVADLCDCFLRECQSVMLQSLLTCLEFPCRMTLDHLPSLLSKEKMTYRALEDEMRAWEYPQPLLDELEDVVRCLFLEWPGFSFWPRHGNGVTSDARGRDASAKYAVLSQRGLPPRLHHYFCQRGVSHPLVRMDVTDLGTSCRVLLVPKGCSSKRVISCEPTANQWFQQALLRDLGDYLPSSMFHITMKDQTRNQKLAQVGSLFRNYGTIDLSSASDTVTLRLVEALFRRTPLWPELWASRTSYATLDGNRLPLQKFAPMGSAVCFPIESIVFGAVVAVAQEHVGVNHPWVVYGDDIVCHSSVFEEVVRLLGQLHFRVNEKKTFWPSSPFKESCGREYYYGEDVTPFRIPRFFHGWTKSEDLKRSPSLLAGWITLANSLMTHGLLGPRRYLVARLLELCPNVPFSANDRFLAVMSDTPSNFHLAEKWENEYSSINRKVRNLCRGRLVRGITLLSKTSPGDDDIRYQMLLEEYDHTSRESLLSPDDLIQLVAGPSQLIASNRWLVDAELLSFEGCSPSSDEPGYDPVRRSSSKTDFQPMNDDLTEWRLRS